MKAGTKEKGSLCLFGCKTPPRPSVSLSALHASKLLLLPFTHTLTAPLLSQCMLGYIIALLSVPPR